MKKIDILFISAAPPNRIEGRVVAAIYDLVFLARPGLVVERVTISSFLSLFSLFAKILRSRVVVIHSPLFKVFEIAICARILRARVWALVWDYYPVRLAGRRFDDRFTRKVADALEQSSLKLCSRIFVPSEDFTSEKFFPRATVLKMWPKFGNIYKESIFSGDRSHPLRIVFAGQVNRTRGLGESLSLLASKVQGDFVLYLATVDDNIPREILTNANVKFLGPLSAPDLEVLYAKCDFGLVSLSRDFEGPAFPSKTLEYVSNGLPVIYYGPDLSGFRDSIVRNRVGVSLMDVDFIGHDLSETLRQDILTGRERFMSSVCISIDELDKFLG